MHVRSEENFPAASGDFVHPDCVENIQGQAGYDPSTLWTKAKSVEGSRAKAGRHLLIVGWDHSDPHQKEAD